MKKADFPYYLTSFLGSYLPGQKNVSHNTIQSYAAAFKLLFTFCDEQKGIRTEKLNLKQLDQPLILDYLDWLESARGCTVTTRNQRLVAMHSFFRYVQKQSPENLENIRGILDIPHKRAPRTIVNYLSMEQMKLLLSQPDGSTEDGFRDLVLMSTLYDTGARVQELVDLKLKHIRLEAPAVITLHGKGDKTRQVPIMANTVKLLKTYILHRKVNPGISKGENYLFVNQTAQKLSRWGVAYIIKKYVAMAEQDPAFRVGFPISAHVFRHSKSMHLLQAGVNLIYIRDFLGHIDCSTTEIYARADTEMKRKAMEASYQDILPKEVLPSWKDDGNLMSFLESLCK